MLTTLREKNGVGIASNQCSDIDLPLRMIIIGTDDKQTRQTFNQIFPEKELPLPLLMINPEPLELSPDTYFPMQGEGCLSVLGPIRAKVARHHSLRIKYFTIEGTKEEKKFSGFPAHIIQHELDHINYGLLFLEKILDECSDAQKKEILHCIQLSKKGKIKNTQPKNIGLSFDRDKNGKLIFCSENFKKSLLQTPLETADGIRKVLNKTK